MLLRCFVLSVLLSLLGCGQATTTPTATLAPSTPTSQPATATSQPTPTAIPPTQTPEVPTSTPQPTNPPAAALPFTPGKLVQGSLLVDGASRNYGLYIPTSIKAGQALPLLVNLHGFGGTIAQQNHTTGFSDLAESEKFVHIIPEGTLDKGAPSWILEPGAARGADVDFILALVNAVKATVSIDEARIFAVGVSIGGGMANRLACDAADVFTGISSVAGVLFDFQNCNPSQPVSIIAIHGMLDDGAHFNGREDMGLPPLTGWITAWSIINQCQGDAVRDDSVENLIRATWSDCANNRQVQLISVIDGGHGWPSNTGIFEGEGSLNSTTAIWEFLNR